MMDKLVLFFYHSVKGRMTLNVAIIHAIIIGIVIFDLYDRQKSFMERELGKKGVELSTMLAANAAEATLRNDIVALSELMGFSGIKDAKMAFLLDKDARVRASSDESYFNLTLSDPESKELLMAAKNRVAQKLHQDLVDTVAPIKIKDQTIGYARIILGVNEFDAQIKELLINTILYGIIAIFAGSLLAYLAIRKMSEGIDSLSKAAKRISEKDFDTPIPIIKGKSEVANMSRAFYVMMESIRQNIKELQKSEEEMEWQATHDALTNLRNRVGFEVALNALINDSKTSGSTHALLFLDLDRFKIINDTAGHLAGDTLLKEISKIMQENIRKDDMLFRFGGDEFGILLKNCGISQASAVGQKIIDAVDSYELKWEENSFRIGVSIGIVDISATSKNAVDSLSLADAACYMAKDKGRNRVFVSLKDDKESIEQREEMGWVAKIKDALLKDKFELYTQKIESLKEGIADHYETLLRLKKSDGDVALPGSFIPAAERYALMPLIDLWVTKKLLEYLAVSDSDFIRNSRFCINLSGQSINDDRFLPKLKDILRGYGDASNIVFEITESVAITNHAKASSFIAELREFNCLFALDDFGSGSSSFAYLKNLPVDYLKIDGSFVKNIFESKIDEAFVEVVVYIADKMNMLVVAEYVENQEIRKKMEEMGVHYAQGFGIEKPLPIKSLLD